MKLKIAAIAAGLVASFAPVALADGSLDAVNADLAKLQADFQSAHDTLLADAQKLQSDAALVKPGNKDQAKAAIKAARAAGAPISASDANKVSDANAVPPTNP